MVYTMSTPQKSFIYVKINGPALLLLGTTEEKLYQ